MDTVALRQKILDLAIRGKLVPQDPNDEPASVLLERIRAEKQQMVKDGKLKAKDIKNDTIIFKGEDNLHYEKFQDGTVKCIEDEIPFAIPTSWSWVRLACLVSKEIKRGKAPKYSEEATNVKVFAQKCNLKAGGINLELAKYLDESALHRYLSTEFLTQGDVIINSTGTGTLGRVGIISDEVEPIVADSHITVVRTSPLISSHYVYCVLKESQPVLEDSGEGSTNQKELRPGTLIYFLVPLPPLSEQNRIAKKTNELFEFIDTVNGKISDLSVSIDSIKSKILDLAIRGKLVPQNPDDEPASVLLERIRAEKEKLIKQGKIKRDKNESVIFKGDDNSYYEKFSNGTQICIDEEIPFDIPKSWQWTRLSTLAQYRKGPFGSSLTKAIFIPETTTAVKVYEQKNAICKDANLGNYYISQEKFESMRSFEVFPNDIIVSCAGTIGETFLMPNNMKKGIINQALMKISLYDLNLLQFYLVYFDFMLKGMANEQGYGNALKNIPPFDILKKYLIPTPPINEQKAIVSKICNLFSIVDSIEQSLS